MAKLSRIERKNHNQACELLKKDVLTMDEKEFVLNNWHEGAEHMNGEAGAFFTPEGLALDFRIEVAGETIIDLCAGIGRLAFCAYHYPYNFDGQKRKIVCVEKNLAYIEVGQKILPEATWVHGDVTDREFLKSLGSFDCAISNPPFGKVKGNKAEKYSGADFEYKVIEAASLIADYGVFIIPQSSAPFIYSGTNNHRFVWQTGEEGNFNKYRKFNKETGISLDVGCGIDTTFCIEEWKGVAPVCEVVTADYEELRQEQQATIVPIQIEEMKDEQLSLFDQLVA